jgi:hypothetical protein
MGFRREPTGNARSRQSKLRGPDFSLAAWNSYIRGEDLDALLGDLVKRSDTDGNWRMRSRECCGEMVTAVAWAADAVAAAARWRCRLEASRRVVRAAGARPAHPIHARLRRPIDQDSVLVEELQPGSSIVTQRRVCAGLESTELKSRKYTSDGGAAHVMANAHTTCDRVSRLTILVFA